MRLRTSLIHEEPPVEPDAAARCPEDGVFRQIHPHPVWAHNPEPDIEDVPMDDGVHLAQLKRRRDTLLKELNSRDGLPRTVTLLQRSGAIDRLAKARKKMARLQGELKHTTALISFLERPRVRTELATSPAPLETTTAALAPSGRVLN